jgi:hypothetical protein
MNIEHENTVRTLADRPLIQKSAWCNFGFHLWEQWSRPYIPEGGTYNVQHRYCANCNKLEARRRKISL